MSRKITVLSFLFLLCTFFSFAQPQISIPKLKTHVKYLASPKLKGRLAGSQQELTAANYIAKNFKTLGLIPKGNIASYFYSFKYKPSRFEGDTVGGKPVSSINVVGFLDNFSDSTIIVCAHYDHLGTDGTLVYCGADDNASGVAGLLELARYYSVNKRREPYNFLFICFSAKEQGAYGSVAFCEKPGIDLSKVSCVIDLDAVGRLNKEKGFEIYGTNTSKNWGTVLPDSGLKTNLYGSTEPLSDASSFVLHNVPAIKITTGKNSETHTTKDDDKKVNFEGEKQLLDIVVQIINKTQELPKFKFEKSK